MDIAVVTGTDARLFVNGGARFTALAVDLPTGAEGLVAADMDNDGDVDLLSYGDHGIASALSAAGQFSAPAQLSASPTRHLTVIDADADGRLDLVTPTALLWNRSPAGGSVRVNLAGLNSNPDGFGTRVEVKTARSRQVQEFRGGDSDPSVLHFGIGEEELKIQVIDQGQVREGAESRRGWSLAIMRELMDEVEIASSDNGTTVTMVKRR